MKQGSDRSNCSFRLCESTMVSNVRLANCARAAIAGHLYNAAALKETAMAMMMQVGDCTV